MNVAVIASIYFLEAGAPVSIPFTQDSVNYECKESITKSGRLHRYTLKFKIPGLDDAARSLVGRLRKAKVVRIRDVNGLTIQLGISLLPVKTVAEENIGGKPGSFRGHEVSITWDSRSPAPAGSFI